MQDFPPNSAKAKVPDEPKNVARVTSAEPDRRKKRLGRQFKDTFIGGNARGALHYMLAEVVVPAIQDTLIEAFQSGVERLIRGESARPRRGTPPSGYGSVPHVSYNSISRGPMSTGKSAQRTISRQSRARQEFDEIVIASRQEAEEVIDSMFDILTRYGSVSVADLYTLVGFRAEHTDHKWGWTQLRGANAVRQRKGGFLLDLPDPEAF